jgi:hypothetical protein
MTHCRIVRVALTCMAAMLLGGACNDRSAGTCEPLAPAVPIIAAGEQGMWATPDEAPRFTEVWRRGGTNAGEELNVPISVAPGPDGSIAIPDFALQELIVVEADGTWQGSWSRRGRGPGEMTRPVAAAWTAPGELIAFDIEQNKIARLSGAGVAGEDVAVEASYAGPSVMRGSFIGMHLQPDGSALLLTDIAIEPGREQGAVVRFDAASGRVDTLAAPVYATVEVEGWAPLRVPGWPVPAAHVGPNGHFAVAAEDGSYRVLVYGPDGRPLHQICRAVAPLPVDERELPTDTTPQNARLVAGLRRGPAPEVPASVGRVLVTAEGGVWVQRHRSSIGTGESLHGVAGTPWDVYDAGGRFLGSVQTPPGARPQAVSGNDVWAFVIGELDETWVVRYRLEYVPFVPRPPSALARQMKSGSASGERYRTTR